MEGGGIKAEKAGDFVAAVGWVSLGYLVLDGAFRIDWELGLIVAAFYALVVGYGLKAPKKGDGK